MRVASSLALHSHAVHAEKPARKPPAPSVIPDRFCCPLRRADCATGYTVHRRRNSLWTLEIVDPLGLSTKSSRDSPRIGPIDQSNRYCSRSIFQIWLRHRYDSGKIISSPRRRCSHTRKPRDRMTTNRLRIEMSRARYHPRTIFFIPRR